MASCSLWAVDQNGCPCRLGTKGNTTETDADFEWIPQPCLKRKVRFHRLTAGPLCVWALGSDGRPYVWVAASPVAIRVVEEIYENQRWYPLIGFTSRTLPTDRASWSTINGIRCYAKEAVSLPSEGWVWEENSWTPDCSIHAADKLGWQYAFNFNDSFKKQSFKKAFVRRRRWVRTRRYEAIEQWVRIKHRANWSFVDITIGGLEIPGQPLGFASVWALTRGGRLLFRRGICERLPEGENWCDVKGIVDSENGEDEISHVSCSLCTGQLWVLTWDGRPFMRTGIVGTCATGTDWAELTRPQGLPMLNVALGESVAWAVTVDGRLWIVTLAKSNQLIPETLKENSWVEMTHTMCRISMGLNDQIFGISLEDEQIYVRTDVSEKELSGHSWKPIVCGRKCQLLSDVEEFMSCDSEVSPRDSMEYKYSSQMSVTYSQSALEVSISDSSGDCVSKFNENDLTYYTCQSEISQNVSTGEIVTENFPDNHIDVRWLQVSAGGCNFTSTSIPLHWIEGRDTWKKSVNRSARARADITSSWRTFIYDSLKTLNEIMEAAFGEIPGQAVGEAQWERNSRCQLKASGDGKWKEAHIHVTIGEQEQSLLSVQYSRSPQKVQFPLKDLRAIIPAFDGNNSLLAFYTAGFVQTHRPLRIALPTQEEQVTWLNTVYQALFHYNKEKKNEQRTLWALTDEGHLMVSKFDLSIKLRDQFWQPVSGHFAVIDPGYNDIVWAIASDGGSWCLNPEFILDCGKLFDEHECQTDIQIDYIFENQRHSAILGYIAFPGLMSGIFFSWSDEQGTVSRTKETVKLPSRDWQWISDWQIDFNWNCDSDGWKYAKSFKSVFYPTRQFRKSRVRRRRWFRKRKYSSLAPWLRVDGPSLRTLSIQKDWNADRPEILVWAVTTGGEVLCRVGANRATPDGHSWQHVISDTSMLTASAGANYRIWALGEDGQAYVRYCANVSDILKCGWHEVPSPVSDRKLVKVAVGNESVWAVDDLGDLYVRLGVSTTEPEGHEWCYVYSDVNAVAIGPKDKLVVTMKYSDPCVGKLTGLMAMRTHCSKDNPNGTDWEYGICGPWISIGLID